MSEVPDYLGPVLGFREWVVWHCDWRLRSTTGSSENVWHPDEVHVAICRFAVNGSDKRPIERSFRETKALSPQHKVPDRDCKCGIYAYNSYSRSVYLGDANPEMGMGVRGIIECGGDILEAPDGFRAAEARIVALILDGDPNPQWNNKVIKGMRAADKGPKYAPITEKPYELLAKKYGVPLLTPKEIKDFVEGHEGFVFGNDPMGPKLKVDMSMNEARRHNWNPYSGSTWSLPPHMLLTGRQIRERMRRSQYKQQWPGQSQGG